MKKSQKIWGLVIALLIMVGVFSGSLTYSQANTDDNLQEGNYIVKANTKAQRNELKEEFNEFIVNELSSDKSIVEISMNKEEVKELKDEVRGVTIEKNYEVTAMSTSEAEKGDIDNWNKRLINYSNAESKEYSSNYKPRIAVIDSGISELSDINVTKRVNLVPNQNEMSAMFEDETNHGTSVAGIIGASGDISGVKGINPSVEIYSVKVLDSTNKAPISRIVEGIEWSVENNVDIINLSLGTKFYSKILHDSIKKAEDKGILVVAAAGNNNVVEYPAAYDEVIAVGGVNSEGKIAEDTALGCEIDIMAPSENVIVTGLFGAKTIADGTSVAAPHVTGVASILKMLYPNMNAKSLRMLLKASSKRMDEAGTGAGIVDLDYSIAIHDDFIREYKLNKENVEPGMFVNNKQIETTEEEYVEARWKQEDANGSHKKLVESGKGDLSFDDEWDMLCKGAIEVDKRYPSDLGKESDHSYLHGYKNYVANYAYLTYVAKYIRDKGYNKDLETKVKSIISVEYKQTADKATVEEIINVVDDIYTNRYSIGLNNSNKKFSYYVYGMALHCLADAYAHRAYGYVSDSCININHIKYNFHGKISAEKGADDVQFFNQRYKDAKVATEKALEKISNNRNGSFKEFIHGEYTDYKLYKLYEYCKLTCYNSLVDVYATQLKDASFTYGDITDLNLELQDDNIRYTCNLPDNTKHVKVYAWTEDGQQDDKKSNVYKVDSEKNRNFTNTVSIKDHNYESGKYLIHIYAYDENLKMIDMDGAEIEVDRKISQLTTTAVNLSEFTIECDLPDGATRVDFPTWTSNGGQDDIVYHKGTIDYSRKKASVKINVSEHNNSGGTYLTDAYAYNDKGKLVAYYQLNHKTDVYNNDRISDVKCVANTHSISIDCKLPTGTTNLYFPAWTAANGQDDLNGNWKEGTISGDRGSVTIEVNEHNYEGGLYIIDIYAKDAKGVYSTYRVEQNVINRKRITDVKTVVNKDLKQFTISCHVPTGTKEVYFPTWTEANGQDDLPTSWQKAEIIGDVATITIDNRNHNYENGFYLTDIYAKGINNELIDFSGRYRTKIE